MDKFLQNLSIRKWNQHIVWSLCFSVSFQSFPFEFLKNSFWVQHWKHICSIQPSATFKNPVLTNTLPLESDKLAWKGHETMALILLMVQKSGVHQLRFGVDPMKFTRSCKTQMVQDFFHQQYALAASLRKVSLGKISLSIQPILPFFLLWA